MGLGGRIDHVGVLGGVRVVAGGGRVIELPSASQRRLLAVLALHAPRRVRAEWLADALGVSQGALRTTVSRLRRVAGATLLHTGATGYSLACEVDASRFTEAVARANEAVDRLQGLAGALALWTGPALDEFADEAWAVADVARLSEVHAGAVDDYADELLAAARATDAVAALEAQVVAHPYRDRSRGLLIRALAATGRRGDALRAFQSYRSLLGDDLGIEPSPELVRIERRVATGWDGAPTLVVAAPPVEAGGGDAVDLPLAGVLARRDEVVGRDAELAELRAEMGRAAESGMRCVLLGGESGIGKTTLLAELARSLSNTGAATVLYGRCDEAAAPLEPLRAVLDACVEHAPVGLITEHVARCGGELARICPRLARRVVTAPEPTTSDDATERFLAFDAAADLLRRAAHRRPLLLALDDLQWAEPAALALVRHLHRALADAPVLVVLSRRDPGEPASDALRAALGELERGPVTRIQLTPFDDAELGELVRAMTPDAGPDDLEQLTGWLQRQAAGNPLYASQLIRHWLEVGNRGEVAPAVGPVVADVPPRLRAVVWSRVHALGDDVATLLRAAAVLGIEFFEDVLLELVEMPERAALDALDVAAGAGLLVDVGAIRRAMRFTHALVASSLYGDLGPSARVRLHERAAHAIAKRPEALGAEAAVQLARHCALAGLAEESLRWSARAGDDALAHLAPAEAAHHYQTALDAAAALGRPVDERADLAVRLGDAQFRAGDPRASATLAQSVELAVRGGRRDVVVRAALAADQGFARFDRGAPEYLAIIEAAVAAAEPGDVASRARLTAMLARDLVQGPHDQRRDALAAEALAAADAAADPAVFAHVAPAVLNAWSIPGRGAARADLARRAVVAAAATGDPRLQFGVDQAAFHAAVQSGDHMATARHLARMRATAQAVGEPRMRWVVALFDTFTATMAGRLEEAEARAATAFELGTQIAAPDAFLIYAGQLFVVWTFAGRHEELFGLVEQAAAENPGLLPFQLAYGIICAAVGREGTAREILRRGVEGVIAGLPLDNVWMTSVIGHAVIAIEVGDVDAARHLLALIAPYADEVAYSGVTSQGPVAAYAGKLASMVGEHDIAEEHLAAALAMATSFGWRYHRATTLLALAEARHRRRGTLDREARAWLTEAAALCRAHGFAGWLPRVEALAAG